MKILIYVVVFFIYSVLRPFVEVILYNIFSATYGHGTDTTALYCGLCAAIFAVSAYLIARWLCKLWDKKQSANAQRGSCAEVSSESTEPELEAAEPSPTIADPTSPAPATPKLRYCKHCGSPLDPATRQCTGCGKQYFRPPVLRKKYLAIAAGALACAAIMFLVVNLVSQKNAAEAKVEELTSQILDLSSQVAELEDTVSEQERQIGVYKRNESSYRSQLSSKDETIKTLQETAQQIIPEHYFYSQHIVLIGEGSKYHKYGCSYLDMTDGFLAYNTENAKYQGYKPCSHCCD